MTMTPKKTPKKDSHTTTENEEKLGPGLAPKTVALPTTAATTTTPTTTPLLLQTELNRAKKTISSLKREELDKEEKENRKKNQKREKMAREISEEESQPEVRKPEEKTVAMGCVTEESKRAKGNRVRTNGVHCGPDQPRTQT